MPNSERKNHPLKLSAAATLLLLGARVYHARENVDAPASHASQMGARHVDDLMPIAKRAVSSYVYASTVPAQGAITSGMAEHQRHMEALHAQLDAAKNKHVLKRALLKELDTLKETCEEDEVLASIFHEDNGHQCADPEHPQHTIQLQITRDLKPARLRHARDGIELVKAELGRRDRDETIARGF